ncbi:MAG: TonB C-terminal domain-containing protein [Polyangiaceae bacterium]|nr:TonB C-terminal domain-containing protein [Polyangiaceae bacterium]
MGVPRGLGLSRTLGVPGTLSLAIHAVVAIGVVAYFSRSPHMAPRAFDEPSFEIEGLPLAITEAAAPATSAVAPRRRGGTPVVRADTSESGAGGENSLEEALHLAASEDSLKLQPDPASHVNHDQHQRVKSANERASREDRRSSKDPMELTFLASGTGKVMARAPKSDVVPGQGVRSPQTPDEFGSNARTDQRGSPGNEPIPKDVRGESAAMMRDNDRITNGITTPTPQRGLYVGAGWVQTSSANIATARPLVEKGKIAIASPEKGRPNDTVDSTQRSQERSPASIHASTLGGELGDGKGGDVGPHHGAGGVFGQGSHTVAYGPGGDEWLDLDGNDPNLFGYFRSIRRKLDPLWANAFPTEDRLSLRQGYVILEFVLDQNGRATVAWPPVRRSGIDRFDLNCKSAIERGSPYGVLPSAAGKKNLRLRVTFDAKNPAIQ